MSYTDPSGFFFDKLWKAIKPFIGAIAAVVVSIYCQVCGATIWNAAMTGAAIGAGSAAINGGNILKGALIGAFSGATFQQIGANFNGAEGSGFFAEGGLGHIAAHGITGGVTSVLQGGKFGHGFLSAGLTKALNINNIVGTAAKDAGLRVAMAAVVGGTISKLTGGKFTNGAITAAFAQAFNGEQQAKKAESLRETPEQRKLREAGDVEGYYKARAAAGDSYAARALMVVQDLCSSVDACIMSLANFGLKGTALINGVKIDMQDVRLQLMNKHAEFVEGDNLGVPGLLNPRQIAEYHHQVFNGLGLPSSTFGGTPLTGTLWEADVWDPIWCKGCDTQ
ncbi:hypothetical protein [Shewanella chilikensis]|uniref:DUF637 domain-containing protein n=3 Tax=Alteromonadales TaxID=135622 RepID=A0A6G7LPY9_9GAMM|nr:hypothetical protein [Shewanella chilikensis]QIJ03857.1 hypothetical protein GII14_06470 [Shewanella chilikensis]